MRWQVKKIQGNQYQCCQRVVKIYADVAVMKTGKPRAIVLVCRLPNDAFLAPWQWLHGRHGSG
jgi:hypothetical protein